MVAPEPIPPAAAQPQPVDRSDTVRQTPSDLGGASARVAVPVTLGILSAGAFAVSTVYLLRANTLGDEFDNYLVVTPVASQSLAGWQQVADDGVQAQRIGYGMLGAGAGLAVLSVVTGVAMRDSGASRTVQLERLSVGPRRISAAITW